MEVYNFFRNYINSLVGRNQEFEQLLKNKDISSAVQWMQSHKGDALEALREYNTKTHDVMNREDKVVMDKNGQRIDFKKVWKLPISYQKYINEIALVFLFGQPVKWLQLSEGTDNAYKAFTDLLKRTRFNSHLRECKRIAGAETESAMLFRCFKDENGKADVQIRVLANSKGDDIFTRWDNYENLLSFAWGYWAKEGENNIYHMDVFTNKMIYHCTKRPVGWEVVEELNLIGKIPVIYFRQEKEWDGAEPLINREEYIASRTADTNDYFCDPVAVVSADVVKNMPAKEEVGKLLVTNSQNGVNNAVTYLTWDSAPESKQRELEFLESHILNKTFTPNITLDTLKSLSNLSGKALRIVMLLADIKASKRKETYDELLDRTASLIASIIGNVTNIALKRECDALIIEHEFQEPFGDDVAEVLNNITRSVDSNLMSQETAVEMNPLVKDSMREMQRLNGEEEVRNAQRESDYQNIFSQENEI